MVSTRFGRACRGGPPRGKLCRMDAIATQRPVISGVIFDFDGTLTDGGTLDFRQVRQELAVPPETPILEHIASRTDPEERRRIEEVLLDHERRAADLSRPRPGAEALVTELRARGAAVGILTRNTRDALTRSFRNFETLTAEDFHSVVTRDDTHAYKPSPAGVYAIAESWGIDPRQIALVGDYRDDVTAALAAGCYAVYLAPPVAPEGRARDARAHFNAQGVAEVRAHLLEMLALPVGKVPPELLREILAPAGTTADESLVGGPAIGVDTGAFAPPAGELTVVTSDPITFPTENPARYLTTINVNDLVTTGARPRWCSVNLLFPPGSAPFQVRHLAAELHDALHEHGIALIGGHSEVTDGVSRLVVSMTLMGSVPREDFRKPSAVRPGDTIIMTKSAGIEGTAILAAERREELLAGGVDEETLRRACRFIDRISVRPEAEALATRPAVRWLHDVTEGGVATALRELAQASGWCVEVDPTAIPVAPETRAVCAALGVDPRGLIGSGALLAAIAPDALEEIRAAVSPLPVTLSVLGTVLSESATEDTAPELPARSSVTGEILPVFPRDEIARIL